MREAQGKGSHPPRPTMLNHATTELFFDDLEVPPQPDRREGKGFRYILSGMNAERILIASECIGDVASSSTAQRAMHKNREVFGRATRESGRPVSYRARLVQLAAASEMVDKAHAVRRRADGRDRRPFGQDARVGSELCTPPTCAPTARRLALPRYDIERNSARRASIRFAADHTNLILIHVAPMPRPAKSF